MMMSAVTWSLAITGTVLAAEIVAGRHKGIYTRDEVLLNTSCISIGLLLRPFGAVVLSTIVGLALPAGKGLLAGAPFWPAFIALLLLAEGANYAVHRACHEVKGSRVLDWLWRMHRTHHTARYVNVLLNFRVSPFWGLVGGLPWVATLGFYLGMTDATGAMLGVFMLWGIVTHSDFRWDDTLRNNRFTAPFFRAFEHVVITPGVHHTHHGFGKNGANYRNYGVFLAIYDWMFGTLVIPSARPARYGLPGNQPHWMDDALSPFKLGTIIERQRENRGPIGHNVQVATAEE
ncbi:sterol desaturase family protein [Novosphingobium album (ex Hu et al. 2023)]|uniref:Sterol desaturase family protein n=1 Tax=Novosphingobium album (ex Hu et al. 2023) TaxID=2930093 RepID=A0ABT0B3H6_9SPHN|nr:sterol desaturase family protein [Novosphingobium album (ex Hu et al. 2023)]MCJ2179587.1 sterol desaturase family protein [Novosphingobium album (ex Hu et al. 2023)]